MRILIVHERYAMKGGEDVAVDAEAAMLVSRGHDIEMWSPENAEIHSWPLSRRLQLSWQTVWNRQSSRDIRQRLDRFKPDLVHFHNTLPIVSPSAIHTAHESGYPIVMTLHNYRLACPVGTFFRDGGVCEDCHTGTLARSILHGCYRSSPVQTAVVAAMLKVHRVLGTWVRCVDAYFALTGFMKQKMIETGLPSGRLHIKPNIAAGPSLAPATPGDYVAFVGRLSEEKGIRVLLRAVRKLPGIHLKIAGTGPLEGEVESAVSQGLPIEFLGQLPHVAATGLIRRAKALVFPSLWYEGLPMTILEAFSMGVPVIGSSLGSIAEIISDEHDGFLVPPGDASRLRSRIEAVSSDCDLRAAMSGAARTTFQTRYAPEVGFSKLMSIYEAVSDTSQRQETVA